MGKDEMVKEKIAILNHIISINNAEELQKIKEYILSIHKELSDKKSPFSEDFKKWNEQFIDKKDLNEPIEEYATTLGAFRKMIYESEVGESFPIEEFQQKLKKFYNEA